MSAVDDVMYIVNAVIKKSLSTAQRDVVSSVIPAVGRVLGSDFVVMMQRKMRDESYPKPAVQGGFPPEDKIISFIVLINSLDMANEYLAPDKTAAALTITTASRPRTPSPSTTTPPSSSSSSRPSRPHSPQRRPSSSTRASKSSTTKSSNLASGPS
jgi:hypothetical protein